MLLSIITCTLNSEKYLQQCIDSVVSQDINPFVFEHVFVDSFSTDKTHSIIEGYQKEHPEYAIRVIQREKKGVYNAMNEGIKEAKGEYVMLLNSDDYLYPHVMQPYLKFMQDTGFKDFYCGKVDMVSEIGKKYYTVPLHNLKQIKNKLTLFLIILLGPFASHPSAIYKKELHQKYGYYNEIYRVGADSDFITRLFLNKTSHYFYQKHVQILRIHDKSLSSSARDIGFYETRKINTKLFGKLGLIFNIFLMFRKLLGKLFY